MSVSNTVCIRFVNCKNSDFCNSPLFLVESVSNFVVKYAFCFLPPEVLPLLMVPIVNNLEANGYVLHDFQFSCAITQHLLAHHWRVHQCLLTSRFTAPLIPWGACAPGGKMRKQLLKDHNFLNNSPIFIIESSTFIYLLFKKHCIQYISIWKIVLDLVKGTWHHNFMAGCGSLLWANTCSPWSGIKSWPVAGCLQRQVRRSWQ